MYVSVHTYAFQEFTKYLRVFTVLDKQVRLRRPQSNIDIVGSFLSIAKNRVAWLQVCKKAQREFAEV